MVAAAVAVRLTLDVMTAVSVPLLAWPAHHIGSGLALAVLSLAVVTRPPLLTRGELRWGGVWFLLVCIGWWRAGVSLDSTLDAIRLWSPLAVYAAVRSTNLSTRQLVDALLIAGVIPLLLALAAWIAGQPEAHVVHGFPRLQGAHANPHNLGLTCALVATLAVWRAVLAPPHHHRWRFALGALALAASLCMIATWVRTAWIWSLVALSVMFLQSAKPKALAGLLLSSGALLGVPMIRARLSDVGAVLRGTPPGDGWLSLGSWRFSIWKDVTAELGALGAAGLVIGHGLGHQRWLHPKGLDPHMDLLTLIAQFGAIGLLLFLFALGAAARKSLRHPHPSGPLVLGMTAAVLITSVLSNAFLARPSLLWAYAGLTAALPLATEPTLSGTTGPQAEARDLPSDPPAHA